MRLYGKLCNATFCASVSSEPRVEGENEVRVAMPRVVSFHSVYQGANEAVYARLRVGKRHGMIERCALPVDAPSCPESRRSQEDHAYEAGLRTPTAFSKKTN